MILSVKGGQNITTSDIRELRGTLERENNAVLAGFISLQEPKEDEKVFHTPTKIGFKGKTGQMNLPI